MYHTLWPIKKSMDEFIDSMDFPFKVGINYDGFDSLYYLNGFWLVASSSQVYL